MKRQFSKHKFYNKYWFKLETLNGIAHIFREKQFAYTQTCLETLRQEYSKGQELLLKRAYIITPVSESDYIDCNTLYNTFIHCEDDYSLRVENPILNIYSNDLQWLEKIASNLQNESVLFAPNDDLKEILNRDTPIIVVKRPTKFKYRVTMKNRVSRDFGNWIDANPDKIKIGNRAYQQIKENGFAHGYYFYVTSHKVLQLIQIMIGGNISRVEEVVVDSIKDK